MLDRALIIYLGRATGLPVHHVVLPEGYVLPAVVYRRTARAVRTSHDGRQSGQSTVTLAVWALTSAAAQAAADSIAEKMQGWQSHLGQFIRQESYAVEYEPAVNLFVGTVVFQIFHKEA